MCGSDSETLDRVLDSNTAKLTAGVKGFWFWVECMEMFPSTAKQTLFLPPFDCSGTRTVIVLILALVYRPRELLSQETRYRNKTKQRNSLRSTLNDFQGHSLRGVCDTNLEKDTDTPDGKIFLCWKYNRYKVIMKWHSLNLFSKIEKTWTKAVNGLNDARDSIE